jgi:ribose 5-phosphate isomerase A
MGAKEAAAQRAVMDVQDGMTIGIGTGSTSAFAIQALAERISREGLKIRAVPTSERSREMAQSLGIVLVDLSDEKVGELDLMIDGADEVDERLNLIKGGGGALLREKIVAAASRELIIICDDSKCKRQLGAFPLPVAVVPFGYAATHRRLERLGAIAELRSGSDGKPYVTDDSCFIYDLHMRQIPDPAGLEQQIRSIVGVVEVGLFVQMATRVIVGYSDGHVELRERGAAA